MATLLPPRETAAPPVRAVESRDPATGEVWRRFTAPSALDVVAAVERAREAQVAWAGRSVAERARVLTRFREVLYARRQEVAQVVSRENGKPPSEALMAEVFVALEYAQYYAALAPKRLRPHVEKTRTMGTMLKTVTVEYHPHGVVGVIAPWNYPFQLAAGAILPALVAGNAVVLKPSEFTPTSGVLLGELLTEAGLPADTCVVVPGDGATGAALVQAGVNRVHFTGSVATGRKVAAACGALLIPCALELGGSDAAIIFADADLKRAARGLAWGRFSNAGQTCVAPKRILVERAAFEGFAAAFAAEVRALTVAAATAEGAEVGPLIRPEAAATIEGQFAEAIAGGAKVLARAPVPAGAGFFPPTVLTDVTPEMRVMREETFGPLVPLVAVADEAEAIAIANGSDFGLSASVWTRDVTRGRRVASQLLAGTVAVNDAVLVAGMSNVPHGGVKASGMGRSHGELGLMECVEPRAVVTDKMTSARQPWWFRYGREHDRTADAFVTALHAPSWLARLRALPRMVRALRGSGT
ncbi:MAG: aldehyde dehydrogenase family protein [Gemmatimonadetes bacterium]|nr:aldehyde dehydrogenase family protein [Gemmatimonadota bacterium]